MNRCTILIASTVLAAGLASAQAIVEHAVAAAGGSAAGVAGKKVSDGIDKVFQKLDKTMKAAEAPATAKKQEKPQSQPVAQPIVSGPTTPPPYVRIPSRNDPAPEPAPAALAPRHAAPAVPAGPPRPPLTSEALAGVPIGTTRDELLALVGRPSSRVVIPDGDRLVEVLSYSTRSQYIGSVRVDSGAVISVRVPQ